MPSLTVQDSIVAELGQLESQARALRQQALQKLDAAKAQVEHFILEPTKALITGQKNTVTDSTFIYRKD